MTIKSIQDYLEQKIPGIPGDATYAAIRNAFYSLTVSLIESKVKHSKIDLVAGTKSAALALIATAIYVFVMAKFASDKNKKQEQNNSQQLIVASIVIFGLTTLIGAKVNNLLTAAMTAIPAGLSYPSQKTPYFCIIPAKSYEGILEQRSGFFTRLPGQPERVAVEGTP